MKKFILIISCLILALPLTAQHYLEIPATDKNDATYLTTYMEQNGTPVRSFSYRYDASKRISLWVAYPLNTGLIGNGSRGDGWMPDPNLPESIQPVLYKGFKYGSGYDRGHQIPSADRLEPKSNSQTFTFTNATPQLHDFNGGIWAELEKVVRTWAKRSDTLYVVTGAIPGTNTIEDNVGNKVNIPSAYYKAVLRLSTDKTGHKRWSVCAVVLPHRLFPVKTWTENLQLFKQYSVSLLELEAMTGETYYPLLKTVVGEKAYHDMKGSKPSELPWWWK